MSAYRLLCTYSLLNLLTSRGLCKLLRVSGFDEEKHSYATPSLSLKLSDTLQKMRSLQKLTFATWRTRPVLRTTLNLQRAPIHKSLCLIEDVLGRFKKMSLKGFHERCFIKMLPWACQKLNRDSATLSAESKSWKWGLERLQFCSHQAWWMLCHSLPVKEQIVVFVP